MISNLQDIINQIKNGKNFNPNFILDWIIASYPEIPKEFLNIHTIWNTLFNDWFFFGLESLELTPKDQVNSKETAQMINYLMRSFEINNHNYKEKLCSYLLSELFENVKYKRRERE